MNAQGLNPEAVWTREYVRTVLWPIFYDEPIEVDAAPMNVEPQSCSLMDYLTPRTETILDVGCGWIRYAIPDHIDVTGVDISPSMFELAKVLHPDVTFVHGDAFGLPFDDDEFDGVRSSGMLRHIRDWQVPLEEMVRVADDHVAFTHLTSHNPGACGEYQWCTTRERILDVLPDRSTVRIKTHLPKEGRRFESTRFLVEL